MDPYDNPFKVPYNSPKNPSLRSLLRTSQLREASSSPKLQPVSVSRGYRFPCGSELKACGLGFAGFRV